VTRENKSHCRTMKCIGVKLTFLMSTYPSTYPIIKIIVWVHTIAMTTPVMAAAKAFLKSSPSSSHFESMKIVTLENSLVEPLQNASAPLHQLENRLRVAKSRIREWCCCCCSLFVACVDGILGYSKNSTKNTRCFLVNLSSFLDNP
jgi:hypothetical protein